MINYLIFLFKRFAWFKRLNAKVTYEILAKYIPAQDWHYMNYGYAPDAHEAGAPFAPNKREQLCSLQMYHFLASKTEIAGKHVLEIGSGRGGGARYIAEQFKPASYTGIDLAQNAVDLANELHQLPNLTFKQGSAERLPFPDESVDVIINVESCHGYGSVTRFLDEVRRVLKPGGYLLLADFRNSVENMNLLREQLKVSGLDVRQEEDITPNVVKAIEAENPAKVQRIGTLVPPRYQKLFSEFAGVVGSRLHLSMKAGTRPYHRFVLQKEPVRLRRG